MVIRFAYLFSILLLTVFTACGDKGKSNNPETQKAKTVVTSKESAGLDLGEATVVVFTKTAGFRHESIPAGVDMFDKIFKEQGIKYLHTEDASVFNSDNMNKVKAVVFLNTTGDVLNSDQEKVMYRMIEGGANFIGVHAAADTEYDWNWYGNLVGAYFKSHPNDPNVREAVTRVRGNHTCTNHLPKEWKRADEWYNYNFNHDELKPLLLLDESSYEGGENGNYHPITWLNRQGKGTMFYTGLGHTDETYVDENFVTMMKDVVDKYAK